MPREALVSHRVDVIFYQVRMNISESLWSNMYKYMHIYIWIYIDIYIYTYMALSGPLIYVYMRFKYIHIYMYICLYNYIIICRLYPTRKVTCLILRNMFNVCLCFKHVCMYVYVFINIYVSRIESRIEFS